MRAKTCASSSPGIYWWDYQAAPDHPWSSSLIDTDGKTQWPSYYGLTRRDFPNMPKVCADGCEEFCK